MLISGSLETIVVTESDEVRGSKFFTSSLVWSPCGTVWSSP